MINNQVFKSFPNMSQYKIIYTKPNLIHLRDKTTQKVIPLDEFLNRIKQILQTKKETEIPELSKKIEELENIKEKLTSENADLNTKIVALTEFKNLYETCKSDDIKADIIIDVDSLKNTDDIPRAVIDGIFPLLPVKDIKKKIPYLGFESAEEYVDHEKEFKDTITKLVTNEFIKSNESNANFLKLVVDIFTSVINKYIELRKLKSDDIVFIYKGGNVLRAIYLKFLYEMPGVVSDLIFKEFSKYFSKSDADFQININPNLENYDQINNEITSLSYLTLNRIRNIFLGDRTKYFDIYKLKDNIIKNILNETLKNLNKTDSIKNNKSPYYNNQFTDLRFKNYKVGDTDISKIEKNLYIDNQQIMANFGTYKDRTFRYDFAIRPDGTNKIILYKLPFINRVKSELIKTKLPNDYNIQDRIYNETNPATEFYITQNDSLDFSHEEFRIKFNLVRMKINMNTIYKDSNNKYGLINIPGELIDISIPHKDASEMKDFWENKNEYIIEYKLNGDMINVYNFTYKSYSRKYFIKDLEKMLFREQKFPWKGEKYEKRVYRLLCLYYIDLLVNLNVNEINELLNNFNKIIQDTLDNKCNPNDKLDTLDKYKDRQMYYLVLKIKEFCKEPDFDLNDPDVINFFEIIKKMLNLLINITSKIVEFVNGDKKLLSSRLQELNQFGGMKNRLI